LARAPRQPRGPGRSRDSIDTPDEAVAYLQKVRHGALPEVQILMDAARAGVEVAERMRETLAAFDQFSPFIRALERVAKVEIALKLPTSPAKRHAFDANLQELAAKLRRFQELLMNARKHLGALATRFDGERSEIKRLTNPWLVMAGTAVAAAAKAGFRPPNDTELAALAVWTGADPKKGSKAQLGERWRKRSADVALVATLLFFLEPEGLFEPVDAEKMLAELGPPTTEEAGELPSFEIPKPEKIRQAFARSISGKRKPEK